ncbi:hypothetical protein [Pediococcus pentosaceus]|uniref:hypothetical protein n=1 Tax=Pediococcus pentosaceus TaxID=1255 RepID=UPI0007623273|nr:hypothetical protein [Pediococcus pentosaceus]NEZ69022.1 hypothetical protein [Pediococcus pentosaceus]
MEKNKRLQSFLNYVYGAAFVIYTFFSILVPLSNFNVQSIEFVNIYKFVKMFLMVVLFIIFLFRNYKFKTFLLMAFCILIGAYGYYVNSEDRMLMLILFAFASRYIHPKILLRYDFVVRIIAFSAIIFLYGQGVLRNSYLLRANGVMRSTLGFSHPNYGGILLFTIILEWILIKNKKVNIFEILSMLGISCFFYRFFLARTDWILTILLLLSIIIIQLFDGSKLTVIIKKCDSIFVWLMSILSLSVLLFVKQGTILYLLINKLLSSRLDIFQFYYQLVGIKLLPQKITVYFQDSTFAGMDNAYIFAAVYDGLILFVVFFVIEQIIAKKIQVAPYNVSLVFLFILLVGLTEALIIYPFINMMVIYFGQESNPPFMDNKDLESKNERG